MSETNAERLRRLRAEAELKGFCKVCRFRKARKGRKLCKHCQQRSRDREQANVAANRCPCGRKRAKGYKQCGRCLEAQRARMKPVNARRRARATSRGKCAKCGRRKPRLGLVTCNVCIAQISAYATARRAKNRSKRRCACGRPRRPGRLSCWRCSTKSLLYRFRRKDLQRDQLQAHRKNAPVLRHDQRPPRAQHARATVRQRS